MAMLEQVTDFLQTIGTRGTVLLLVALWMTILSLCSFFLYWYDKRLAQRNQWRIPERTLLLSVVFGGGVGALLAMYGFRHKTKHRRFTVGVPLILVLQLVLLSWCVLSL